MHIYIKKEAVETLRALQTSANTDSLFRIQDDPDSKEVYIRTFEDPFSPIFAYQLPAAEMIDRFTVRGIQISNFNCFRVEGIYRHNGAELLCRTYRSGGDNESLHQHIDVCAPTLTALQEIYFLFRKGLILPVENWEAPQIVPATDQAS